jgi:GNAT superfamily N-acetyltransferase
MHIRALKAHEVGLHRSLRLRALRDTPEAFGETLAEAELQPGEYWRDQTRAVTESSYHAMFLACQNNAVHGSTYGLTDRDLPRAGRVGGMWIDSRYRRQGIGRALLEAVFACADERNFTSLGLWAPAHSPAAVSLYRQMGFYETGKQRSLPSNTTLNIIEMACKL